MCAHTAINIADKNVRSCYWLCLFVTLTKNGCVQVQQHVMKTICKLNTSLINKNANTDMYFFLPHISIDSALMCLCVCVCALAIETHVRHFLVNFVLFLSFYFERSFIFFSIIVFVAVIKSHQLNVERSTVCA